MKQFYILLLLALTGLLAFALAQETTGGTVISNTATATFTDSNGADRSTQSNTVTTRVRTVYSFEILEDDGRAPVADAGDPTVSGDSDYAGYTESDNLNDADVAAGADATFTYTLVNNTNNDIEVTLNVDEDDSDDFNLGASVGLVRVLNDDNTLGAEAAIDDGRYVLEQETSYRVTVTGTVPPGQDGNDVARIDLRAENFSAANDPVLADRATGPEISFENNNIARVTVLEEASIGVAKDTASTLNNGDGSYTLTYRLTAENLGNVTLSDVTLTDDVSNFPGATGYSVAVVPVADQTGPGTRVVATAGTWNGTNSNILGNNFSLSRGQSTQLEITFTFAPGTNLGPYSNQASITGTSPNDVDVTDLSDDGINPDEDDDGLANEQATEYDANNDGNIDNNEGVVDDDGTVGDGDTEDENDPTLVTLEETPVLGVAKEATTATEATGFPGQFETTIDVRVENLGDVVLSSLDVTDDLDATFPAPATYEVTSAPSVSYYNVSDDSAITSGQSSSLTLNGDFDGDDDTSLTTPATSSLATGEGAILTFTVRFDPNGLTEFSNQAAATAESPAGVTVTDLSDNGTEPDVGDDGVTNEQATAYDLDGNGTVDANEGVVTEPTGDDVGNDTTEDDNDPTPITFNETPALGVAKNLDSITQVTNASGVPTGEFDATFTITAQNYSNVDLNSIQITDDLDDQFGNTVTISSVTFGSATDLTQNPDFFSAGGVGTSTNLLTGNDSLEPDESGTITFTVRFDPNGATGLWNSATATAQTPGGVTTNETSTNGTDPDANDDDNGTADGDGNPNESDPTPVTIPETPVIGVANTVASVTNNGDGSYDVTYTLTVENFGNVDLKEIQLVDDLSATFTNPATYDQDAGDITVSVTNAGASGTGFTLNPDFDGDNDTNLLDPNNTGNTLAVGETKQLTVTVTVTPGTNLGPFNNSVTATGESPADATPGAADTTDTSTNSVDGAGNPLDDPDQDPVAADGTADSGAGVNDNDNDPTNNTSPTPVTFVENTSFTIEKSDATATYVADGQWRAGFTITVVNTGDVELRGIQIQDDLDNVFTGTAAFVRVTAPTVEIEKVTGTGATTSVVSGNSGYDGKDNINLLDAGGVLAVNEQAVITFTVADFDPGSEDGPFTNTATVTGATSPSGTDVAAAERADGDDADTGEISYASAPALGLAKNATVLDADTDNDPATVGPFEIQFDFYIKNTGNVDVLDVSIEDTLDAVFTVSTPVTKVSGPDSLNVNAGFDGRTPAAGDNELVAADSSLEVGETAQLRVIVTAPAGTTGSYTNTATATADGPQGNSATEDSNDGIDPDAPGDNATPINLDALELIKTARTCDTPDCLVGGPSEVDAGGATVEPGQYIVYTIQAQNVGNQTLTSIIINDPIPTWGVPVADNKAQYVHSSVNTSANIQCSTNNGTSYSACTTSTNPDVTVTDVRLNVGTLTGNDGAAGGDDTATFTFVVFIP